jgi:hypothetical protein
MQLHGATMEEYRKHCEMRTEAANYALRGIPEDRIRYHICLGLVGRAAHQRRAPASHCRPGLAGQCPGLLRGSRQPATRTRPTSVEHPETVAERIQRYASVVGRENVIAGTDCGFAQGWTMVRTHPSVQWAKLQALADGAPSGITTTLGRAYRVQRLTDAARGKGEVCHYVCAGTFRCRVALRRDGNPPTRHDRLCRRAEPVLERDRHRR